MHHSVKTEECSLHQKPSSGFCPKPQFPSSRIDWLILQTEVKSLKIEIGGFECHTVDVDEGNYQSPGGEGRNVLAAATALPWPPSSFLLNVSTTSISRCSIFQIEKIELSSAQDVERRNLL